MQKGHSSRVSFFCDKLFNQEESLRFKPISTQSSDGNFKEFQQDVSDEYLLRIVYS